MRSFDPRSTGLDPDLVRVAAHEAGHAITAVLMGGTVTEIKVWQEGDSFGGHVWGDFDEKYQLDGIMISLVAGHEAEAMWLTHYLGYPSHRVALRERRSGCKWDMATFRRHRRRNEHALTEPAARGRAHSLLIAHWGRVERLADRLARTRHLTTAG